MPYLQDTRHPCLYLYEQEVSTFMYPCLKKLHLTALLPSRVDAKGVIPRCSHLTELRFQSLNIDKSILEALSNAVEESKLPMWSHLSFEYCDMLRKNCYFLPNGRN